MAHFHDLEPAQFLVENIGLLPKGRALDMAMGAGQNAIYLAEIPLIYLDISPCLTAVASDIVLPGVIDAMECDGVFYRLDDVAVHFEPFTSSPFSFTQSNEDTLKQLFAKVREKRDQVGFPSSI